MSIANNQEFPFWEDFIAFCQRLIQTPSVSGNEGAVALLIQEEMKKLQYNEVWADPVGNVIGILKGNPDRPALCFTGHMDTVPPGDEKKWEHPPFSGVIADGYLHGRGAGDMKCAVASHVYLPAMLRHAGLKRDDVGDIYVIPVAQEEVGGLGSKYLDKNILKAIDYAVNSEPTSNMICTGHRGRAEITVSIMGKAAHASRPWQGINPFFDLARFLLDLDKLEMPGYRDLKSTAVPTVLKTDTATSNVIPGQCILTIDWRNVPGESETQIMEKLNKILPKSGTAQFVGYDLTTYTGKTLPVMRKRAPFSTDENHPAVKAMVAAVKYRLNKEPVVTWWEGANDCGYFADAGIPIAGFGPSESKYSHTSRERISLEMLSDAVRCLPAIVANLSQLEKRKRTEP